MDALQECLEDRIKLKIEIKEENDVPLSIPENVPIKDELWPIDLNNIKFESDSLDVENETESIGIGSVINIKTKSFRIKSDDAKGIACELVKDMRWEEDLKEKTPSNDNTIESMYSIKHEDVEIKSEENHRDTPLQCSEDEPDDSTGAKASNHSMLKHKMERDRSKDKGHGLKHRVSSKKHECNLCNFKTIFKSYLKKHQLKHEDVPEDQMHKCESCDYKTIFKQNLMKHLSIHKDIPEEQMFKCDWCEYKTGQKDNLKRHEQRRHTTKKLWYKCDSCDFKTSAKDYLTRHLLRHKPEEKMFKCDLCDYKTIYRNNIKLHQQTHTGIPKRQLYQCQSCDYKTNIKYYLTRHQLRHKDIPEDEMYKCDLCDYKAIFKSYIRRHQLKHRADV